MSEHDTTAGTATKTRRSPRVGNRLRACAAVLAACGALLFPADVAHAVGPADVTAQVLAGGNVTLSGDSIINLPGGTTTYNGVFSGQGTLTIAGTGTLVLTKDSALTLPTADQHQSVTTSGGNWPYPIIGNPDPPTVIVDSGATLQYGNGGSTGIIGSYPYSFVSGLTLNQDNIEVDGTLELDIANREFNLGTISGSGDVTQPRNTWGTLDLADNLPFNGTIGIGTGMNLGSAAFRLALPNAAAIDNDGSAIISARNYTLVIPENFYEANYGTDVNFHTWQAGLIEMTGVDHYTNPSLDTSTVGGTVNYRGINIEGANVQWGDGTTDRFFLPATPSNSYINIHDDGSLAFDYDGPVTLDTSISGGIYQNSLSTPANASITISPTSGNAVTFATPMNYHGTTTIGHGATLLLGTGQPGGDSSLLTGASNDAVIDDGTLTVRNTKTPVTLENITGPGSLTQAGSAATTLVGTTSYTGPTTITGGTLALGQGADGLSASSSVTLTAPNAVLDLSQAGNQTIRQLSGVTGSTLKLGGSTLTITTSGAATYAGTITGTGAGVTTTGTGTLTLTGQTNTPGGTWHLNQGSLILGSGAALHLGSLIQAPGTTLSLNAGTGSSPQANAPIQADGTVQLGGTLIITNAPQLTAGQKLTLIQDTGTSPITGTFTGLPQGATVTVDGHSYKIDYSADGGHDVDLTSPAAAASASASGTKTSAAVAAGATNHKALGHARAVPLTLVAFVTVPAVLLIGAAIVFFMMAASRRSSRRPSPRRAKPARSRRAPRTPSDPPVTESDPAPATEPPPTWPGSDDDTLFIQRIR